VRALRNVRFNNRQHFINYCRKISVNKLGGGKNHIGWRNFTTMLRQIWKRQDPEEIENFIYKLSKATPEQLEASLRRLKDSEKEPSKNTGMYGIWSAVSKQFVFGIQEPTKKLAFKQLIRKIGKDSFKYRFSAKRIKDCPEHREMLKDDLKFKEGVAV